MHLKTTLQWTLKLSKCQPRRYYMLLMKKKLKNLPSTCAGRPSFFTIMNLLSIIFSTWCLRFHHHELEIQPPMSGWTRVLFLQVLPAIVRVVQEKNNLFLEPSYFLFITHKMLQNPFSFFFSKNSLVIIIHS